MPSWEETLKNRKKLTPTRIMNNVGMNSKNVVNNVGIFNDSVAIKINSKKIVPR